LLCNVSNAKMDTLWLSMGLCEARGSLDYMRKNQIFVLSTVLPACCIILDRTGQF